MPGAIPDSERPPSAEIDTTTPSVARVYDCALGGTNNYEVDRALLGRLQTAVPEVISLAVTNRAFLIRAVRFLASQAGMDQFLDCGSGLPTAENTHQVAQHYNSDAKVVYVDNDPVVLAHGRALLAENDNTVFVSADIFKPEQVLENEVVRDHLDFSRPLALLQVATLHAHSADAGLPPVEVMRRYVDALPSGSYVALSHVLDPENEDSEVAHRVQAILNGPGGVNKGYFRTRSEIMEMLEGLELVEPGLVINDDWWPGGPRMEEQPAIARCIVAAVGRKP